MSAKAFFLFTASCSSHLYMYFSQRVLCSELPKDLFTQWLTDAWLSRFIVPYRLWWNKNLQLGPSKIHYISESAGRVCHRGCDKWKHPWMWAERPHHQPLPRPSADLLLGHTHRVPTQTLFESKKLAACVRGQLYMSPCREWMQGNRNTSPLCYLSSVHFIRVSQACSDPYTLCRPACWALMETKATGHSVSNLSSCCPPHCPCIVPRSGCEKEQCLHYPWQPIISGQPTQTEKLARFFSLQFFYFFFHSYS